MAEVDPYFWRVQNPPISHWFALQRVIAAAPSSACIACWAFRSWLRPDYWSCLLCTGVTLGWHAVRKYLLPSTARAGVRLDIFRPRGPSSLHPTHQLASQWSMNGCFKVSWNSSIVSLHTRVRPVQADCSLWKGKGDGPDCPEFPFMLFKELVMGGLCILGPWPSHAQPKES